METFEIILIVFGSSGIFVFILIFAFRWLSITFGRGKSQNEPYIYKGLIIENGTFIDNNQEKSMVISTISIDTIETDLNSQIDLDESITISNPYLKRTTRCKSRESSLQSSNLSIKTSIDTSNLSSLEVNLNYNSVQDTLELKFIHAKIICYNSDRSYNFTYLETWLNNDTNDKKVSSNVLLDDEICYGCEMKWPITSEIFMNTVINVLIYKTDLIDSLPVAQTKIQFGDIYTNQPINLWIYMDNIEKMEELSYNGDILVSLRYLPTAQRLTAIVVRTKNLKLKHICTYRDIFAKISLVERTGKIRDTYKTTKRKSDSNVIFNEISVFKLSTKDLNDCYLIIKLLGVNNGNEETIGYTTIGESNNIQTDQTKILNESCFTHWKQIMRTVTRPVLLWHPLMG